MTSEHIRWILGGLFLAMLVTTLASDLIARLPKRTRIEARPKVRGFRRAKRRHHARSRPANWRIPSWKSADGKTRNHW